MEAKNWTKPSENLIYSINSAGNSAGNSASRVEYIRLEESIGEAENLEDKIKTKEKNKNYLPEYQEFIKNNKNTTSIILEKFLMLWYKPNESIEDFRKWVDDRIIKLHNITSLNQIQVILDDFYIYWKEQPNLKNKVWKTTLTNNYDLKALLK